MTGTMVHVGNVACHTGIWCMWSDFSPSASRLFHFFYFFLILVSQKFLRSTGFQPPISPTSLQCFIWHVANGSYTTLGTASTQDSPTNIHISSFAIKSFSVNDVLWKSLVWLSFQTRFSMFVILGEYAYVRASQCRSATLMQIWFDHIWFLLNFNYRFSSGFNQNYNQCRCRRSTKSVYWIRKLNKLICEQKKCVEYVVLALMPTYNVTAV